MRTLGLDTSNYTTSAAVFDGRAAVGSTRPLAVPAGALGLRQQEALFQHVKALPELLSDLRGAGLLDGISAVAASVRPRAAEGSYMPCFLAGESVGRSIAAALNVPFHPVSHQQGHLAAAAFGAGRPALMDAPFLAWHLSGGTTELLRVTPVGGNLTAEHIGGTTDLSAGQLIDRTGQRLGLAFPAGPALDALAMQTEKENHFTVKTDGLFFSLSGVENQVDRQIELGAVPGAVARFVLDTLLYLLTRVTAAATAQYPGHPVLCSGGVAASALLRASMDGVLFAPPAYSADNALGVSILAARLEVG